MMSACFIATPRLDWSPCREWYQTRLTDLILLTKLSDSASEKCFEDLAGPRVPAETAREPPFQLPGPLQPPPHLPIYLLWRSHPNLNMPPVRRLRLTGNRRAVGPAWIGRVVGRASISWGLHSLLSLQGPSAPDRNSRIMTLGLPTLLKLLKVSVPLHRGCHQDFPSSSISASGTNCRTRLTASIPTVA